MKKSYIECCTRKERSGIPWSLARVWIFREIRKKIREDARYVYVKRASNKYG
jgi:hypothetical protein